MAKTLVLSSQTFVDGVKGLGSPTSSGTTSFFSGYDPSQPAKPLLVPRFFPFSVSSNFSQSKLLKPFRLRCGSEGVISSLISKTAESRKMLGGFYKIDREEFGDKEVIQELWLLSQQTGITTRPGTTLEFLQFFFHRNFNNDDIPVISVILGNLLFRVIYTKHFFELAVVEKAEKLHSSVQIFCVQELG